MSDSLPSVPSRGSGEYAVIMKVQLEANIVAFNVPRYASVDALIGGQSIPARSTIFVQIISVMVNSARFDPSPFFQIGREDVQQDGSGSSRAVQSRKTSVRPGVGSHATLSHTRLLHAALLIWSCGRSPDARYDAHIWRCSNATPVRIQSHNSCLIHASSVDPICYRDKLIAP